MKYKIKELLLLCCAVGVLALLPLLYSKDQPIEVNVPALNSKEMDVKAEEQHREAAAAAVKAQVRRMYRCQTDEDCIIVAKDPCGCLVGPSGVTAINAEYTLDFNKMQSNLVAKACPDRAPSTERECSPDAQAVCVENVCKIRF